MLAMGEPTRFWRSINLMGTNNIIASKNCRSSMESLFLSAAVNLCSSIPSAIAFAGFPYRIESKAAGLIFAGKEGGAPGESELGGIDYASPGHGMIALHANKGITFDLDAIRRANPGWRLVQFRAVAGDMCVETDSGVGVWADLWVFVDGQNRFARRNINKNDGAIPVTIPILDDNRFLTLVATDGGNGIGWDHTMFGDPQLEMVLAKPATDPTPQQETVEHQDNMKD